MTCLPNNVLLLMKYGRQCGGPAPEWHVAIFLNFAHRRWGAKNRSHNVQATKIPSRRAQNPSPEAIWQKNGSPATPNMETGCEQVKSDRQALPGFHRRAPSNIPCAKTLPSLQLFAHCASFVAGLSSVACKNASPETGPGSMTNLAGMTWMSKTPEIFCVFGAARYIFEPRYCVGKGIFRGNDNKLLEN